TISPWASFSPPTERSTGKAWVTPSVNFTATGSANAGAAAASVIAHVSTMSRFIGGGLLNLQPRARFGGTSSKARAGGLGDAWLLHGRGLSVRPAPYELLVEWNALATEGALLWTVSGKVPAYEAEHRSPAEVDGRSTPETAHAHDLGAQLLDELDQQIERAAGRDEVFHEQHLRPGTEKTVKFDREPDPTLTTGQALRSVDHHRTGGVSAGHAVREDESARPRRQDDVDGPLGEVLGDHRPEPLGERGLGRHERLLDVLARVLAGRKQH